VNIFYLDEDPIKCARAHYDKHVVKMILEYAQILSTTHRVLDGQAYYELSKANRKILRYSLQDFILESNIYKAAYINHPCNIWCRKNTENYQWLFNLWIAVMEEYTFRYDKHHASERLIPLLKNFPKNLIKDSFINPPSCVEDYCKVGNTIEDYRNCYRYQKIDLYSYKKRLPPDWINMAR
jgi:hypothetical protein